MGTHLITAMGDLHAGGSTAICPPEGIELDDGGFMTPNKIQTWLYECWRDCWDVQFRALYELHRPARLTFVANGDLIEGHHHNSPQASPLVGQHFRAAHKLLETGPLVYKPDYIHFIRGTEAHVGRVGELEEGLARTLKAEGHNVVEDPDTGQASSFWRRIVADGVRLDVRHHGRAGFRAHTRGSLERYYSQDIELEHYLDGVEPPHLAIRSHNHRYMDSGKSHKWTTRLVGLPCWQAMTSYAHRITAESLSDVGIVCFIVKDGRLLEPEPVLYKFDRPTEVTT